MTIRIPVADGWAQIPVSRIIDVWRQDGETHILIGGPKGPPGTIRTDLQVSVVADLIRGAKC